LKVTVDAAKYQRLISEADSFFNPGSLSVNISRIDTVAKHRFNSLFDADCTTLRTLKLNSFIREARCGEFDYTPSKHPVQEHCEGTEYHQPHQPNGILKQMWKEMPRLWVLVTRLDSDLQRPGRISAIKVEALFRGDAMWKTRDVEGSDVALFRSNDEYLFALQYIQQCSGFDKHAFLRFMAKYQEKAVLASIIPTGEAC